MRLKENLLESDIENIYNDILTFLKNVNRLKNTKDFFELLEYYFYWYFNVFQPFIVRITGKSLPGYEWYKNTMVGKAIGKIENSMTDIFTVDNSNFKKYYSKDVSINPYEVTAALKEINTLIGQRRVEEITKNIAPEMLNIYFDVWKSNQNSRYISAKKRIEESFDFLFSESVINQEGISNIEDKFIDHFTEYEGVEIELKYPEYQYNAILDTLGYVKSAIKIFAKKEIKYLLKSLTIIIDFATSEANGKIKTSYGDITKGGMYRLSTGEIFISQPQKATDDIIAIVAHELAHKYYYEVMNQNDRKEWEEYFKKITNPNPINYEYLDMMKADFIDLLSTIQSRYMDQLRIARDDIRNNIKVSPEWLRWKDNYDDLNVNIYYIFKEILEKKGNEFEDLAEFLLYDKEFDLETIIKEVKRQIKKEKISLYDEETKTLTPAANRDIIDVYYEEITRAIGKKKNGKDYSQLPSGYSQESPAEFFAETMAAVELRKISGLQDSRTYRLLDVVYDEWRRISGLLYEQENVVLKEVLSIILQNDVIDQAKGQLFCELQAYLDNIKVGYIQYYIYNEEVHINMIKVDSAYKNLGIGSQMMEWLIKDNGGYQNIWWGMTTKEGSILKAKFDKKYGEQKPIENHLPIETIDRIKSKNRQAGNFAEDLFSIGYEKTWEKWLKKDSKWVKENNDMLNDLGDIVSWIKDSKINDNYKEDETPEYIFDMLEKWFKIK